MRNENGYEDAQVWAWPCLLARRVVVVAWSSVPCAIGLARRDRDADAAVGSCRGMDARKARARDDMGSRMVASAGKATGSGGKATVSEDMAIGSEGTATG